MQNKQTTYKNTELGLIPEDWKVRTLGDFSVIKSGESPSKFIMNNVGTPYFKVEQLNNGIKYTADTPYHIQIINPVKKGSIVFPKRGASIMLNKIRIFSSDSYLDTNLMALTLDDTVYSEFIFYVLSYFGLDKIADTTSIPQINNKHINPFPLALPPSLSEQKAIATALSDTDALISSLEQLIAKKRAIKQGAMQELLRPKDGWEVKKLGETGTIITGSTPPTQIKDYWNGSIPWITPTDILNNQKDIFNSERKITNAGLQVTRKLPANTLLVTCIASIGKNVILRNDGACNQQINAIIPYSANNVDYLYFLIENSKSYLIGKAGITATMMISKKEFSEVIYSFPDLEEQTRIAIILSDMDTELQNLEIKLQKYKQIKQGIMQQLLTGKIRLV